METLPVVFLVDSCWLISLAADDSETENVVILVAMTLVQTLLSLSLVAMIVQIYRQHREQQRARAPRLPRMRRDAEAADVSSERLRPPRRNARAGVNGE